MNVKEYTKVAALDKPDAASQWQAPSAPGGYTSFAELLEQYLPKALRPGQLVEGHILRVSREGILIDIGAKRDAIVPKQEASQLSEAFLARLTPGGTAPVVVTHLPNGNDDLEVSLRRGVEEREWQQAEELLRSGAVIQRPITGLNKGGVLIGFGTLTGFVPNSHLAALRNLREPSVIQQMKTAMIGETLSLKVIEIDHQHRRLVLSAREAEQTLAQARLHELKVGMVVTGQVESIKDFGVFVNLNGIIGLIHVTKLDWFRVTHPADILHIGDEVQAVVEAVDLERGRVRLNRRAALPDPWQRLPTVHAVGDLVAGTVTNVTDFGVFVHLPIGVEGLIHRNELCPDEGDTRPLTGGDPVVVRIVNMAPEQKRLGLSLRQISAADEAG